MIQLRDAFNKNQIIVQELADEIEKRESYLESLKFSGKISASKAVNSGVKINIKDVIMEVAIPYDDPVTFMLDDGFIKVSKYEEIEEDLSRR